MCRFKIVEVDGFMRTAICKDGKANKYGEPKLFKTLREAQNWIDKHSYVGMSFKYEIVEVKCNGSE